MTQVSTLKQRVSNHNDSVPTTRPFLKWVGGKRQLIDKIRENLPSKFNSYHEPFLGGGAVFFSLVSPEKNSFLSDVNQNLIEAYLNIRDNLARVISTYSSIIEEFLTLTLHEKKIFFSDRRTEYNSLISASKRNSIRKTALLIFLNKTCFNGIYRENSKGEFNVPYGQPNFNSLQNIDHLEMVSAKLQSTSIQQASFEDALLLPKKGDFVYLDPPYVPLTTTANFTKYSSNGFSTQEHIRLAKLFSELSDRGCYVLMSNSQTEKVRELYSTFSTIEVDANRNINCKGNLRKPVKEVLIKNY